jgi:hypothetical protein
MKPFLLHVSTAGLYLATCTLVGTGLLLEWRLDEDVSGRLLGMDRDDWGELHFGVALAFAALTLAISP